MVYILSATAEIRRGKKKEDRRQKKPQSKNILACPIPLFHRAAIIKHRTGGKRHEVA